MIKLSELRAALEEMSADQTRGFLHDYTAPVPQAIGNAAPVMLEVVEAALAWADSEGGATDRLLAALSKVDR